MIDVIFESRFIPTEAPNIEFLTLKTWRMIMRRIMMNKSIFCWNWKNTGFGRQIKSKLVTVIDESHRFKKKKEKCGVTAVLKMVKKKMKKQPYIHSTLKMGVPPFQAYKRPPEKKNEWSFRVVVKFSTHH